YDELNLNLYNWSIGIIKGNANEVWSEIKEYAPNLFAIFSENELSESLAFVSNDVAEIPANNMEVIATTNHYKEDGLE
ncbi:MAG TPA: hypothetical protein PLS00_18555, partial [Niabella sp.]|nr:hypothetical protein [Niabella sp.]